MGFVPPPLAVSTVQTTGLVNTDAPCRKCGYNLRGMDVQGRCPECGAPVGLVVHGTLLKYSNPKWVWGLKRGVSLIIWGIIIMIFAMVAGFVLAATVSPQALVLMGVAWVLLYAMMLMGWWLLTEQDPSGLGEDDYDTSRKIIRITLVIGLVSTLLSLAERFGKLPPTVARTI